MKRRKDRETKLALFTGLSSAQMISGNAIETAHLREESAAFLASVLRWSGPPPHGVHGKHAPCH